MVQDMPAPPEAEVIKTARLAAPLSVDEAVAQVRAAGGQISATYWRDIERGHGGRRGKRVPTRASEGLLAQMARVVGVPPAQLAEAGRQDAARILEEILRREDRAPLTVVPDLPGPDLPERKLRAPEDVVTVTEPYRVQVLNRVVRAQQRLRPGEPLDGRAIFTRWREDRDEANCAQAWDTIARLDPDPVKIAELWAVWRAGVVQQEAGHGGAVNGLTVRLART